MATSATILACRFDVNLGVFMTPGDEAAVWALRGEYDGGRHMRPGVLECREHDTKPELARYRCDGVYTGRRFGNLDGTRCPRGSGCGRVHGAWLYIASIPGSNGAELRFAHHPDDEPELKSDGCSGRIGLSPEHRAAQDLTCEYTQGYGWESWTEHRGQGTVADVLARTPAGMLVCEIQVSPISVANAKGRDTKHVRQDNIPVWTLTNTSPLAGSRAVASYAVNDYPRTTDKAATDNWWVTTPFLVLDFVRCGSRRALDHFDQCPQRKSGRRRGGLTWCHQMHPVARRPEDDDAKLRVIEQVGMLGEGEILRLDTGLTRIGVVLVDKASYQRWRDEMGEAPPRPEPPKQLPLPCSRLWTPQPPAPPPPQPTAVELPPQQPGWLADMYGQRLRARDEPAPDWLPGAAPAESFWVDRTVMQGSRAYYAARKGWPRPSDRRLRDTLSSEQLGYLDYLLTAPSDPA